MTRTTSIEWTEHTWNPIVGCSIASSGCKNCYAMRMANRIESFGTVIAYSGVTKTVNGNSIWSGVVNRSSDTAMIKPLSIKGSAMIFVNSMSDLFHENAEYAWISESLSIMRRCPQHTFQVLTKRPENVEKFIQSTGEHLPENMWLGVSVENESVSHRINALKRIPAHLKFISFEPLIGSVGYVDLSGIDWAIVGGESGPKCRPCNPIWVIEIRDMCVNQSVSLFFKQWGHWRNNPISETTPSGVNPSLWVKNKDPEGKGGSLLDGVSWKEFPSQHALLSISPTGQ